MNNLLGRKKNLRKLNLALTTKRKQQQTNKMTKKVHHSAVAPKLSLV